VQACSFLKGEIENGGMNIFLGKAGAYAVFFFLNLSDRISVK